ncbi:glycoside hydrolase family 31 protein [Chryseobacterium echinoideorum]|uniref:glycoside hydrolase family 31 protein n=1 Tax=Chryseobacterium echinoideorum TaxID=1549648 RepID=UPI0011863036|nr:TIM-barrel domain-containing protein [Chryseobacterium echinoideorum]
MKNIILAFFLTCFSSTFFHASEVLSYSKKGNQVIFNCKDGSKLSLTINSNAVVKIWYDKSGKLTRSNPSFAVVNDKLENMGEVTVNEETSAYEIFTSKLRIRINKNPMQLQIFDKYQKLIFSDFKDQGHVSDAKAVKAYKVLRNDEQFFGLGEKTGTLNRRGKNYKMWNSDKPCYSVTEDPIAKSIPFFMSSYRYGIFLDNTYKSEFKFGTESQDYYSFEAPDGAFVYYFIYGKDYKEIQQQYIALTGQPIMPPKWALGFAQSRGLYTKENQALEVAAEFRKRKIPIDIIYQDIGWTQNLQDFEWRKGNYTDPKGMLKKLKANGFKMIVSQDPVISKKDNKQYLEANKLGYFVKDVRTDKAYEMPWPWGGNCGVVDFTLPAVADWWGKYQQKPLDDGISGFWTDMGEPAWSNEEDTDRLNMKHHLGMHDEIHNVFGLTWDKVVKEQFEKRNPNRRIFQMTRSAYAGLQRYTFGWTNDSGNGNDVLDGWAQMENQVAVGISAGLGGIPFWTTDISGYCGDITDYPAMAELYTRWMQFGVFCPLSRAHHEGDNAVEPWMFGEVAEKNTKAAIELKYQLFPYLYTYSRKAHDTGLPITRGLFMEYPNDTEAAKIDNQFIFGEELLVAPVLKKGERVKRVYLPDGEWIDFNDKKTEYLGGQTVAYKAPLNTIPIFVKKASIIPMMPVMQYIHEKKDYPVFFHIFPNYEDEKTSFSLYEDDGENQDYLKDIFSRTNIVCTTKAAGYDIEISPEDKGFHQSDKRNFVLSILTEQKPKSVLVNGKEISFFAVDALDIEKDTTKTQWSWDEKGSKLLIKIPDNRTKININVNN